MRTAGEQVEIVGGDTEEQGPNTRSGTWMASPHHPYFYLSNGAAVFFLISLNGNEL